MRHGNDERFFFPNLVDDHIGESLDQSTSKRASAELAFIDWKPQWIASYLGHRARYALEEILPESPVTVFVVQHGREQFGLGVLKYAETHERVLC
jgi:hypothetical protein